MLEININQIFTLSNFVLTRYRTGLTWYASQKKKEYFHLLYMFLEAMDMTAVTSAAVLPAQKTTFEQRLGRGSFKNEN